MDERDHPAETMTAPDSQPNKEQMNRHADAMLVRGMRVRLDGTPINTTLATPFGKIVAEEEWGTYLVHLDSPATYHNDDGTNSQIDEIRVLAFNLSPTM